MIRLVGDLEGGETVEVNWVQESCECTLGRFLGRHAVYTPSIGAERRVYRKSPPVEEEEGSRLTAIDSQVEQ